MGRSVAICSWVALSIALAACGSRNESEKTEQLAADDASEIEPWDEFSMDGCELVTDDEIRAALGEPVESKEEGGYFGCRWTTASHRIYLGAFATTALPADTCTENQTSMPFGKTASGLLSPVEDLGDRALWGSSGELHVCTRRGLLVIDYQNSPAGMSSDDEKLIAVEIARHALARLG